MPKAVSSSGNPHQFLPFVLLLFVSLLIFARKHGLFSGADVRDGDKNHFGRLSFRDNWELILLHY